MLEFYNKAISASQSTSNRSKVVNSIWGVFLYFWLLFIYNMMPDKLCMECLASHKVHSSIYYNKSNATLARSTRQSHRKSKPKPIRNVRGRSIIKETTSSKSNTYTNTLTYSKQSFSFVWVRRSQWWMFDCNALYYMKVTCTRNIG